MKNLIEQDKVVVVLTGEEKRNDILKISKIAAWIELRTDCFIEKFPEKNYVKWAKKIRDLTETKIIGTVRWHKERQNSNFIIPDKKRIEIYSSISKYIDLFDVELNSRIVSSVCDIARKQKKQLILSYHNFNTTPSKKYLLSICKKAISKDADIVKIATAVNSEKDLFTLISILMEIKNKIPAVVIPMKVDFLQRLVPLAFGSLFTYVALSDKTAPGQPTLNEIIKTL